jgi:molybdenum transport protein
MQARSVHIPDGELDQYLLEDAPYGDLTTELLGIAGLQGRITYRARHRTILSSTEEAARLLAKTGCRVGMVLPTGTEVNAGEVFLEATGDAASLHTGWKPALNLLEHACGIATRTHSIIEKAREVRPDIHVAATRKIFPGTKRVATKAVLAGGAFPHRLGLSETILIFAQHVTFLGGFDDCLARVPEYRATMPEKKIAIEVASLDEGVRAADADVDIIQADKMAFEELEDMVCRIRATGRPIVVAAAGGVGEHNASAYARTGVDLLVTSSMYWGKPADIQAKIEKTG